MLPFEMIRHQDCTGVSGTGKVLEGIIFPSGKVFTEWTTEGPNANGMYNTFGDFLALHVFSHPTNQTEIRCGEWEPINN